jgi:hypothetical protein
MDTYTEEFPKIVTGEVIWWHQRCIVCKKLCREKVSGALNRCITVLENYFEVLVLSSNVTLTFNPILCAPPDFWRPHRSNTTTSISNMSDVLDIDNAAAEMEIDNQAESQEASHSQQQRHVSMENILGVPVEILYRHTDYHHNNNCNNNKNTNRSPSSERAGPAAANNHKPLLTRSEAETFLKIQLLAQEMDVILQTTEQVTQQQHQAKRFQQLLEKASNPWLTPLLPLLKELTRSVAMDDCLPSSRMKREIEEKLEDEATATPPGFPSRQDKEQSSPVFFSKTLLELHASITELVAALQEHSVTLWQSAEQNFALADSLWDIVDGDGGDGKIPTKSSPTYILAKEKQALAELQEHLAQRIDTVLMWQYKESGATSQPPRRTQAASFRTQLFGNSQSQRLSSSQRSTTSHDGEEEDRGMLLSMEEIFTPLSDICDRLFGPSDDDKSGGDATTPPVRNTAQFTDQRSCSSSAKTGPSLYEASQNTANAASTMMSLLQTTTATTSNHSMDPTVAAALQDGNDHSRDSVSTTTTAAAAARDRQNQHTAFDYPTDQSPARRDGSARKRRWTATDGEENDVSVENSQFVKASAAKALASMVSGRM